MEPIVYVCVAYWVGALVMIVRFVAIVGAGLARGTADSPLHSGGRWAAAFNRYVATRSEVAAFRDATWRSGREGSTVVALASFDALVWPYLMGAGVERLVLERVRR